MAHRAGFATHKHKKKRTASPHDSQAVDRKNTFLLFSFLSTILITSAVREQRERSGRKEVRRHVYAISTNLSFFSFYNRLDGTNVSLVSLHCSFGMFVRGAIHVGA